MVQKKICYSSSNDNANETEKRQCHFCGYTDKTKTQRKKSKKIYQATEALKETHG